MILKSSVLAMLLMVLVTVGGWSTNAAVKVQPMKAATVHPVGAQDFTLVNETGVEIHGLYISPTHVNNWEEDILGQDTLATGGTVNIHFSRQEKAAKWDIKVQDSSGNALIWEDINLLEISKVTLYYNNGQGTASLE